MNFNAELIEKAKTAAFPEELLEMAKKAGFDMTAEEAASYYAQLNPAMGELDDDELDNVAGGGCGGSSNSAPAEEKYVTKWCPGCGQTVQIEKRLDSEGDIDGYFGVCPSCGKIHFNL